MQLGKMMIDPEEFLEINDNLDNLVAIIAGYRNKLEAAEFDRESATDMVKEFHWVLMQQQIAHFHA